ncbi:MAG: SulP family inorganic anion transporter [Treponema sp.]|nr:SulP family inorganic anion transporter [Treponema sp.]
MIVPAGYAWRQAAHDCVIGAIIALVSIPISMGYALVAGLPVVCGLYGSLLPIAVFAFCTTSPRFVFGVDAAPAVLVGGMLLALGIEPESADAVRAVPCIALCVSAWLFLFFILKADRILNFISRPVMGGFITGIGVTIICMQVPKLFGGRAGSGEILELLRHIWLEAHCVCNLPSLASGLATVTIILLCRRFFPRFPVQPVLMFFGAGIVFLAGSDTVSALGIQTLPAVGRGLPPFSLPDVSFLFQRGPETMLPEIVLPAATIALVILSETLLAESNIGSKYDDAIDTRREVLSYAFGNLAAAVSGSCPVNGSVSRTGIADQYGVKSQLMSLSAAVCMLCILLFGTGFISYLPVPVLTGIVISALIGTFEFSLAHRLRAVDKTEFVIFYGAFFSVLLFGTIYGVVVGIILSACTFIIRQTRPATDFLGIVPGMKGFYSLTRRGSQARAIQGAVIYRFSGPLFYANISQFCDDILRAIKPDTRAVIVDASGITSVDAPAAERLLLICSKLRARQVLFYLAGHVSAVNDQLRAYGSESLIYEKVVRPRIPLALSAAGFVEPYQAENAEEALGSYYSEQLAEFDWAFGTDSERLKTEIAQSLAESILQRGDFDAELVRREALKLAKGWWNDADEDDFLDVLEMQILSLHEKDAVPSEKGRVALAIEEKINLRHALLEEKLLTKSRDVMKTLVQRRHRRTKRLKDTHPAIYEHFELLNERYFTEIAMEHPELAKQLADLIADAEKE